MLPSKLVLNTVACGMVGLALMLGPKAAETVAQSICDPNYGETPNGCVLGDRDYDCRELWERGLGDIPVIGSDWMRLDGYQDFETGEWVSPPNGLGCEWVDAGSLSDQQPRSNVTNSPLVAPEVTATAPNPTLDPLLSRGNDCLAQGDMVCAFENFQTAYTTSQDPLAKAALYDYYLLNGDLWQSNRNLDSARQSYADAIRLDPANPQATERLSTLEDYVAIELFETFETFGAPGMYEAWEGGATVHQVTDGVLALSSTMDEFQTNRYFDHTPQSPNYAIVVDVQSAGPTTGLGIILAREPSDAAYRFSVDPTTQEWWIAYHNADGSWTDMILPISYAGMVSGPIERLMVEVRDGTPKFFANGVELSSAFDLSWMQIPRTGHPGVSIDTSVADPWAPISATFDSFGIYDL